MPFLLQQITGAPVSVSPVVTHFIIWLSIFVQLSPEKSDVSALLGLDIPHLYLFPYYEALRTDLLSFSHHLKTMDIRGQHLITAHMMLPWIVWG